MFYWNLVSEEVFDIGEAFDGWGVLILVLLELSL